MEADGGDANADGGTNSAVASNGVASPEGADDGTNRSEDESGKPAPIDGAREANGFYASSGGGGGPSKQRLLFCERFVEFLIDLMSQAPTRRYTHTLLEDKAVLIKCRMCPLFQHEQGNWLIFLPPQIIWR